jgi:hypothetical protein
MFFLQHQNGYLLEGTPARAVPVLADGSTWDIPRGWVATDYPQNVIDAKPDLFDTEKFTAIDWTVEKRRSSFFAVPTLVSKSGEATEADILTALAVVKTEYAVLQRTARVKEVENMILQRLKEMDKIPNAVQQDSIAGLASQVLDEIEGT